jgi:excisionase family DNA binding protein
MARNTAERFWLRPREAAEHLGISISTLYAWRKKGLVRFHRIGPRAVALRRGELDELAAREAPPSTRAFGRESLDRLWAVNEELRRRHGVLSDSVPVIRAARDEPA